VKNPVVGKFEQEDLKKQVAKVLRGLGNPEPPLNLLQVRELLKLDVRYYSSTNDSFLQETISRMKIAGKQIIKRPSLLLDVVKKAKISALWIPDHKRILIDQDSPKLKHRWYEGHEIGHSLAEWHGLYLFGDDKNSLGQTCHEKLESEANFASGQLLFLQDRFVVEANDSQATLDTVKTLSKTFGNTIASTLWRFVEETHLDKLMVGVVSHHPHHPKEDFDAQVPIKYLIESVGFREQFGTINILKLFSEVKNYCSHATRGPLGSRMITLEDVNGESHLFRFESFYTGYDCLTLGVYVRKSGFHLLD
jgi:Zn-dependent peptidase ImmA (M78 family)